MRLKIINPNTSMSMTKSIENACKKYARTDTEVIAVSPRTGPESIESYYDEYLSLPGILEEIKIGDSEENIDAYIIACFGDPGLYGARETTNKIVIGIAEAAILTSRIIAPNFSIISVLDRSRYLTKDILRLHDAEKRCCSIRTTNLPVLEFDKNPGKGLEAIYEESLRAINEDGAECILLGCAGFVNFVDSLQIRLGVPVLDGVVPALKLAEAFTEMKCKTSKILTWKNPEPKKILGFSEILRKY